jgi:ABC-type sugar transport system ATPase subunit
MIMRIELARPHRAQGATIVYVTHDEVEPVTLGVRPAAFRESGEDCLSVIAEVVEHLGADTLVHARPRGSARLVTVQRDGGRNVTAGQPIEARFAGEGDMVFGMDGRRWR